VIRSNRNKTEKRQEKTISWWRHHLHLDVAARKAKIPYRQTEEVADAIVVLIFNRAIMWRKRIHLAPRHRRGGGGGGDKSLVPKKTWHEETLNLEDSIY